MLLFSCFSLNSTFYLIIWTNKLVVYFDSAQVALVVKNQCRRHNRLGFKSLGREDPLEEEMATYSSMLAWRIPWAEEPGGLQSMGSQRVGYD